MVFSKFFYVAAPNTVSDEVVKAMNEGLAKIVDNKALNEYAANAYVNITSMTPEETEAYFAEQYEVYAGYLKDYIE